MIAIGTVVVILVSAFCGMQILNNSGSGEPISGTAGPLQWTIQDGFTLVITGEGAIPTYSSSSGQPWASITTITDIKGA